MGLGRVKTLYQKRFGLMILGRAQSPVIFSVLAIFGPLGL
jgi:hypothetical protein